MSFDLEVIKSGYWLLSLLHGVYDGIKSSHDKKDEPDLSGTTVVFPSTQTQTSNCNETDDEESELLQQQEEEEEKRREEEEQEELDNENVVRTCIAIGIHNLQSRQ